MKNSLWIIALLFTVSIFQSCVKEPITEDPATLVAPELPPMSMYSMPNTELENTDTDTLAAVTNGMTYHNWFHAAVNLVVWHSVVTINMAIPTAAFNMAFNEQAEYIGDSTFEWDYTYAAPPNLGGQNYYVVLTGQYINNFQDVLWVMTVSQQGGFSNFVWYTGIVSTTLAEGEFTLNRFPANPEPFFQVNYTGDEVSGNEALRFTNVIPASPDNGQYIEYRNKPSAPFNLAFDVQGAAGNFIEILWSEVNGDGQVRHPFHFNDNDWHCWDTNQIDIECE